MKNPKVIGTVVSRCQWSEVEFHELQNTLSEEFPDKKEEFIKPLL